jgi:hypothetical protein
VATKVEIPSFQFSAMYYPQLLEALLEFKRIYVPEITDETALEPFIQFLRAQALVGHLNNTLLDLVANETTLPTATLVESVRNMLRLIAYEMKPATPSQVEMLLELSEPLSGAFEVVPVDGSFATKKEGDTPPILFAALEAKTLGPTLNASAVFAEEATVFTDVTADAVDAGNPFTPWAAPAAGDKLYIGHEDVLWTKIGVILDSAGAGLTGIWEYYDGVDRDDAPSSAANLGPNLRFNLNDLLGTANRAGASVRVQLNTTTAFEDCVSLWDGSNNYIVTTGLLGQTTPSTTATDYTVGAKWKELSAVVDGTTSWTVDGDVEYTFPKTVTQDWLPGTVNGIVGYFLRYRIISVVAPVSPSIERLRIDTGKQYTTVDATQGRRQVDSPLGSSNGEASQSFETSKNNYILGSAVVEVDNEEWVAVANFLNSKTTDKHYTVTLGANDRATITFGDGIYGRIPNVGVGNIVAEYRFDANTNGNVGANTIVVDKSSLTLISKVTNPRAASGWAASEGSDASSLERAKVAGPASIRVKDVAISPDDVETLATSFVDDDGASPVGRTLAIEEGFGPKTIELVVVAKGGGTLSPAQRAALDLYFNGDRFSSPVKKKRVVANTEVTSVNYTPKVINVVATVKGDFDVAAVENQLQRLLHPEALQTDGISYEWDFAGEVPTSRIIAEIFEADGDIRKVTLTTPAADVTLATRELPILGTVAITKVP